MMNKISQSTERLSRQLHHIWIKCVVVGILLALLESVIRLQSPAFFAPASSAFARLPLDLLCGAFFWLLLQTPVALLIIWRGKISQKLLRFLFVLLSFFYLYSILILTGASWFYYVNRGSFLTNRLLKFAITNFTALELHFMQTGMAIFFTLNVIVLILTLLIMRFLSSGLMFSPRINRNITIFALIELVATLVCFFAFSQTQFWENTHPVLAYSFRPETISRPSVSISLSKMKTELIPKTAKVSYNSSMIQTGHPVFVFMLESMRRDLIYVKPSPIPFMKSLMKESIFFDKAYAASSHSNLGDLSVWYSQYPLRGDKTGRYGVSDPWRGTSIFKVFHQLGYKTAYISSQNEKWGGMINWLKVPAVDYYFDSENYKGGTWVNEDDKAGLAYLIKHKVATAGKVEDSATIKVGEDWINQQNDLSKLFVGFNLQNTHFSYVIPKGGKEPFKPDKIDFPTIYAVWPKKKAQIVRNRYLNAFYNMDNMIKGFVDFLKEKGIWDDCYFIIVGDSGEAFYEHGIGNHSGPMYDEEMRTFCLIKVPGSSIQRTINVPISHIDIFPGLLDLMKVPIPGSFQGISPFSKPERKNVYMCARALVNQDGIFQWPWKLLITAYPKKNVELYNLEEDPGEKVNKFRKKKEISGELYLQLQKWYVKQTEFYSKPELYNYYYPPKFQ